MTFRRFLTYILCFVLGFATCIASIVGVGWVAYSRVSLDELESAGIIDIDEDAIRDPDAEVDITKMTLQGLVAEITKLSKAEQAITIDLLIERYRLKLPEEILALIPAGVRDLPLTEILSESGIEAILENTQVEYLYSFLPPDLLSEPAKEALADKTLKDVVDLNLGVLLEDVCVGYLLGVSYVKDEVSGKYSPVYANPARPTLPELISEISVYELLDVFANGGDLMQIVGRHMQDVYVEQILGAVMDLSQLPLSGVLEGKTIGDILVYNEASGGYDFSLEGLVGGTIADIVGLTPIYHNEDTKDFIIGWRDANGQQVYGILRGAAEIETEQLLGGSFDLAEIFSDVYLGDVMSYRPVFDENGEIISWVDENSSEPDGVIASFVSKKVGDLMSDGFDLSSLLGELQIGELLGYEKRADGWYDSASGEKVSALYAALADLWVEDLVSGDFDIAEAFDGILLGELLGYEKRAGGWYDSASGEPVSALYASLADLSVSDLISGDFDIAEAFDGILLGELLGYEKRADGWYDSASGEPVSALYASLADLTIGDLMSEDFDFASVFDDLLLGELLGYEKRADGWYDSASGEPISALYASLADLTVGDLMSGEADVEDALTDLYLGELLGYEMVSDGLGGYLWYETRTDGAGNTILDGNGQPKLFAVSKLYSALADLTVGDLMSGGFDLSSIFEDLTLGELLGYEKRADGWYESSESEQKVSTLYAALADLSVGDLMSGNADLSEVFADLTLGELLGYEKRADGWYESSESEQKVSALYAALADLSVGDLMSGDADLSDAFSNLYFGDLLGYEKVSDGLGGYTWYETRTDGTGNTILDGNGRPKLFALSALYARIADLSVDGLMNDGFNFESTFRGLSLGHVLGYTYEGGVWYETRNDGTKGAKLSSLDAALAEMDLGALLGGEDFDLASVFDDLYLGELLGYERGDKISGLGQPDRFKWYEISKNPDGSTTRLGEIGGIEARIASYKLGELLEGSVSISTDDLIDGMTIGEIMGYSPVYKSGSSEIDYWVDAAQNRIDGFIGAIAGEEISSLENGSLMSKITLGDALGYYFDGSDWYEEKPGATNPTPNKVGGIMGVLAGKKVDQLGSAIDSVYIGEILGYVEKDGVWYETYLSDGSAQNRKASGIMAAFASLTVGEMSNAGAVTSAMNQVTLGDALGYYFDSTGGVWLVSAPSESNPNPERISGITAAFADLKVGDMSNASVVSSAVNGVTLGDAMGYYEKDGVWYESAPSESNPNPSKLGGVMSALAGTKIGGLSSKLETAKIGELLGYSYDTADGIWRDGDNLPTSPLISKICDSGFGELNATLNALSLGDIFTSDELSSGFFLLLDSPETIALKDVPTKASAAVQNATIGRLISSGLLTISAQTEATLNTVKPGWKDKTIEQFINSIVMSGG